MSKPVFLSLEIEAFRGFRDRQRIELAASAVVLSGPNGTGKTSLFDAIQWLLVGRLGRLEPLRVRRNEEHIVNIYAVPGPAVVEAEMHVRGGRIHVRRSGRYDSSLLELEMQEGATLRGPEAEHELERLLVASSNMELSSALLTSALLQQDEMRYVLEEKPSERYEHLSRMMGLGVLEDFEDSAARRTKEISDVLKEARNTLASVDTQRTELAGRLETLKVRIARGPGVDAARRDVSKLLASRQDVHGLPQQAPSTLADASRILADIQRLSRQLRGLQERYDASLQKSQRAPQAADLGSLRGRHDAARAAFDAADANYLHTVESERNAQQQTEDFSRLAALAAPMLSHRCPVCGQRIDPQKVRSQLESRAGGMRGLADARTAREQAQRARDQQRQDLAQAEAGLGAGEATERVRDQARRELDDIVATQQAFLTELGQTVQPGALTAQLSAISEFLENVTRSLQDLASAFVTLDREGEVARLEAEQKGVGDVQAGHVRRVDDLSRREAEAKALADAAKSARVDVVSKRFTVLEPLVLNIYQRLDPHPTFKSIVFEHEVYRAQGTTSPMVRDDASSVMARPQLVFSSSQANVVALSYFLATGLALGQSWLPFLLLDDPLQTLDDVNVLGFADLCRFIREKRQLIVSTHDTRLARLLERKLAPRTPGESTLVLEFTAWSRSGPEIEPRPVDAQLDEARSRLIAG